MPIPVKEFKVDGEVFVLTEKQKVFSDSYAINMNGKEAARDANYCSKFKESNDLDKSKKDMALASIGSENLTKPNVRRYVDFLQKKLRIRHETTKDEGIAAMRRIVEANEESDPKVAIQAQAVINKMIGFEAPKQLDVTSGGKEIKSHPITIVQPSEVEE